MIINYKQQAAQELEIGRPYTYGVVEDWFMRVGQFTIIYLGSDSDAAEVLNPCRTTVHMIHAQTWPYFRYANSMEVK